MTSKEELQELKMSLYNKYVDNRIIERQTYILLKIEHDLQILNLLARYCTFTDNTITFNATITDENEIKLLKEWANNDN